MPLPLPCPCSAAYLSSEAQNLVKGLLQKEASKRLGYGPSGSADVMKHPFFKTVDWRKLEQRVVSRALHALYAVCAVAVHEAVHVARLVHRDCMGVTLPLGLIPPTHPTPLGPTPPAAGALPLPPHHQVY